MTDAIQADLERAQQMHQMISDTLAGSYDGELRSTLFAGFMSVCLCHHEAILSLVKNDRLTASALALMRPLVESGCRGLFAGFEATPEQLETIRTGGEPYPPFRSLIALLDKRFNTRKLFGQYGDMWKLLNDFTHTGIDQLSNRFDENGTIGSHHSEGTICELMRSSTSTLTRVAIPFLGSLKSQDAATSINDVYIALYPLPTSTTAEPAQESSSPDQSNPQ
jgi:hypothetical protein